MAGASPLNRFSSEVVKIMPLMLREFSKREDNVLSRGQITFRQMVALHYAYHKPCVTMTELAHVLSIQTSSTTVLVDRLVRSKMLRRYRDTRDRRVVWVCITVKGKKVIGQILEQKRQSIAAIFGILSARERSLYLKILSKVFVHLQKSHEKI